MNKRFWFTNEEGDNIADDYIGNIRGARKAAEKLAKELHENIYINDYKTEDIVDVIFC